MADSKTVPSEPEAPPIPVTLSTASVYPRRAAYAFEAAADLGYDGVEVMVWSDPATQDASQLARLAADHGVPVRSIHAPTLLVSQRVWGRSPAPKLRRSVDMALEVGASTVVVHPPFRWQYKYARLFQDQVRELEAETGVTLAVENMYPWRARASSDRHYIAYLPGWDATEHDYDSVTLDLSHAAVAGQTGMDLVATFGDRLRHLHLADGTGSPRDEHLVPGRGAMDCDKVLAELAARGWKGDVVVEIATRKARTANERRADLEASLKFARSYLQPVPEPYEPPPPEHQHRPTDAW
ncbi:sugar phosphate isomerase/epimerase [Xylanimonas oleitrophica]|uniref:Sugar phosphate isomerase/epimerase n=1 Tax=Xylanimonas oleitrophica TaxID=2607479 RepID=A0A2W5WRD4_9MICO|nr:sugar phosphate isomerase/epimerase [Xylanimonas oleitrophica]PZR53452.1 sugar phosphate isomerase/epimerase [Xylanimonas oleitrophica]